MKKNDTLFSAAERRLTLVGRREGEAPQFADGSEDAAADYPAALLLEADAAAAPLAQTSGQALVFVIVSVACAAAALASGTYAVWLTRRQATQSALTDVRDLLRTCHDRMVQLEDDLHRLPPPAASPSAR